MPRDTIVEAIKELAENSEKVKLQENEIEKLQSDLDENKEELHYLRNKLDNKRDMIDDLEYEIEKKGDECVKLKKSLEMKELDFNKLEMLIIEQVEEINILRDNNQSMVSQIAENLRMEKKISIQKEKIDKLKDEMKEKN